MSKLEPLTKDILDVIENRKMVAHVYKDSVNIGITIEYSPKSDMLVSGLKPDSPPYVWFKGEKILYSKDNKNWNDAPEQTGFEVLRLFDPRVVLKNTVVREKYDGGFDGICSVVAVTGSDELETYLSDPSFRKVSFKYNKENLLTEMRRRDLPPTNEELRFEFSYKS